MSRQRAPAESATDAGRNPPFSAWTVSLLQAGRILPVGCSVEDLVDRALDTVLAAERRFGTAPSIIRNLRAEFCDAFAQGLVTLGTPVLTNASRGPDRALGSCVAVPVRWDRPLADSLPLIESYYLTNMGSGFNLDAAPDPVAALVALNDHAERVSRAGLCERYIGNMANVGVAQPRVREFVRAKVDRRDLTHFNISVAVSDEFLRQLSVDRAGGGRNGAGRVAADLWKEIVNAAWSCGDPGLLFLDRFNRDNPTPSLGEFQTTAPCAEVGLAPGESCVFGYLNLGRLTTEGRIDFECMAALTRCLVRVLDDALEVSLDRYPDNSSRTIMGAKRKIGVAVCGLADLLATLGVPYGSAGAVETTRDVRGWSNYASKLASRELGRDRGSFPALPLSRYVQEASFLCARFGNCCARMV